MKSSLLRIRLFAAGLLLLGVAFAYFDIGSFLWPGAPLQIPFRLGLDLQGGTHLVYRADTSGLQGATDADEAMAGLRDVIERRVNFFGVTEPVVQVQKSGDEQRLIVELAGVFDTNQAIRIIGETPFLEFKTERPEEERVKLVGEFQKAIQENNIAKIQEIGDPYYLSTELTGRYLESATLIFDQTTGKPGVSLQFNSEGATIFEQLTRENVGKTIAIYLDGSPVSTPVVQSEISGGQAQITGQFTPEEARDLVRNLNSGALPVPIELISQQNIGASLGQETLRNSLIAGLWSLLFVALFMIALYRIPGCTSIIALFVYVGAVLFVYKIMAVTLTLAGIAGFILSLGMAVDANVLIFARMREEMKAGKALDLAVSEGFRRAWPSIRDSHVTTFISAVILYTFTTSLVRGFGLTLGIGVLLSLLTSTVVTRVFLSTFVGTQLRTKRWLFS